MKIQPQANSSHPSNTLPKVGAVVATIFLLVAASCFSAYALNSHHAYFLYGGIGAGVLTLISTALSYFGYAKSGPLEKAIPEKKIPNGPAMDIVTKSEHTVKTVDLDTFKKWLLKYFPEDKNDPRLRGKRLILNKFFALTDWKERITAAINDNKEPVWTHVSVGGGFDALLKEKLPSKASFKQVEGYYTYATSGVYVDFANQHVLGGGALEGSYVMEEKAFTEFVFLYFLAYETHNKPNTILPRFRTAFLTTQIKRDFAIDGSIYGGKGLADAVTKNTLEQGIKTVEEEDRTPIRFAGIAAQDWSGTSNVKRLYTKEILLDHLGSAYAAFQGAKDLGESVVHTGQWGCGAFANSLLTMTILQMTAADMAGINLKLYSVPKETIQEAQTFIQDKTPNQVLDTLLEKQQLGNEYAPK